MDLVAVLVKGKTRRGSVPIIPAVQVLKHDIWWQQGDVQDAVHCGARESLQSRVGLLFSIRQQHQPRAQHGLVRVHRVKGKAGLGPCFQHVILLLFLGHQIDHVFLRVNRIARPHACSTATPCGQASRQDKTPTTSSMHSWVQLTTSVSCAAKGSRDSGAQQPAHRRTCNWGPRCGQGSTVDKRTRGTSTRTRGLGP